MLFPSSLSFPAFSLCLSVLAPPPATGTLKSCSSVPAVKWDSPSPYLSVILRINHTVYEWSQCLTHSLCALTVTMTNSWWEPVVCVTHTRGCLPGTWEYPPRSYLRFSYTFQLSGHSLAPCGPTLFSDLAGVHSSWLSTAQVPGEWMPMGRVQVPRVPQDVPHVSWGSCTAKPQEPTETTSSKSHHAVSQGSCMCPASIFLHHKPCHLEHS